MSASRKAEAYRAKVKASGNKAEYAAIVDMSDEFVAAIADGDFDAATRALDDDCIVGCGDATCLHNALTMEEEGK